MNNIKPVIAISIGDINGIGPEILAKALHNNKINAVCRPVIFGSTEILRNAYVDAGFTPPTFKEIKNAVDIQDDNAVYINNCGISAPEQHYGTVDPEAGCCAMEWVREAVHWVQQRDALAIVTAPINKVGIHQAGYTCQGHTDFIAELCGTDSYRMCLFTDTMRIVHITGHLSLRNALDAVTEERILSSVEIAYKALNQMGFESPKIAVAGLNPHAGEAGAFGCEEIDIIKPAIEKSCAAGYKCSGPYPPDTVFKRMHGGEFDLVIAMYHDQGHVPLKLIAMDEGVNVTLGLPIIRTSVDHGTAYEIAGKNIAREDSMLQAVKLAAKFSGFKTEEKKVNNSHAV